MPKPRQCGGFGYNQSPFTLERVGGIALGSRSAVAELGLGTASLPRLLARHRSGVRFPTEAKQFASSTRTREINQKTSL